MFGTVMEVENQDPLSGQANEQCPRCKLSKILYLANDVLPNGVKMCGDCIDALRMQISYGMFANVVFFRENSDGTTTTFNVNAQGVEINHQTR